VAGRVPARFDLSALPAAAEARDVVYDRFGVTLIVESPEPFTVRYLSFAFPGWSARVDGERVPITPEDPTGLITFDVPAGTHEIAIAWGATPLRLALVALSALSAVGMVALVIWMKRRPTTGDGRRATASIGRIDDLHRMEWGILFLAATALLGVKLLVDRLESPLRSAEAPPVAHPAALLAGELRLDGFNLSRDRVPAGETFDVDMAWTAVATPTVDYQSEIALVGPDGLAWSEKGTERPRLFEDAPPTRQWTAGEWAWDSREVRTLSGAPPGVYDLVVTLFDKATLAPATIRNAGGEVIGPSAVIGQIEVVNPDDPPDFAPQFPVEHEWPALGLRLLGYNQDRAEAAPGDSVLLTLFWECIESSLCERFVLRLEDESGIGVMEWWLPAVREDFPLDAWPNHGRLRGQYIIQLPAALPSGRYRFLVEDFPLGEIAVTAPERQSTPPPLAQELGDLFSSADGKPVATLVGLAADSSALPCSPAPLLPCSIPLVWRAEAETPIGYHVFVHLVDESGNILAQSDGVPANWTRPTTGWLPGEYVIDTHTLTLPAELPDAGLSFRVGLYNPATGTRLRTNGAEYAVIPISPDQ
jgi:hypothetical protein